MKTSWKDIPPVPTNAEFVDIVLSSTQRRLPTQIRAGFQIARIRAFYTRKVKFTAEGFSEKLTSILTAFPRLADLHPFYSSLFNVLYDADHYKIALSHLSGAKNTIETIARDYVRLIKYAQSLYQAKSLKRAGLGRMSTVMRRLKDSLAYLEEVRQHIGRLPSIDPTTRTLLVFGLPNTGKSSFVRSVSRTDTPVDSYAFTTKSLFCGHFDFDYLRFQVIDTPGVVDKPLEDMTTIEMQSISALAHLNCAVLFFLDPSEQCGYTLDAQCALFKSLAPIFSQRSVYLVSNKSDLMKLQDLEPEARAKIEALATASHVVDTLEASCHTGDGLHNVKDVVCRRLIADRVAKKLGAVSASVDKVGTRGEALLRRIHVARPMVAGGGANEEALPLRETFVPEAAKERMRPERLERDLEAEQGGPGVYNFDLQRDYVGIDPEHQHDKMPEVYNGQNVLDFYSPDIEQKMAELEAEEEKLIAEGYYDTESDDDSEFEDAEDLLAKADKIREKLALIRNDAKLRKRSLKNNALIPRSILSKAAGRKNQLRGRGGNNADEDEMQDDEMMDVDDGAVAVQAAKMQRDVKTAKLKQLGQKNMNRHARQGEADRHIAPSLTKHLLAGKRGMGKTNRR
ncbi:nucleolar GTP-binding protein [Grosmannia clavigera kw1407]|uniref:Nucleolar GTP-binding protein 1 n=1 Tax=Grosmannia clavigera (strain kw1407 / UAMH 11150) TaxID=655863 RepID=F0XGF5_GROCL|nr:nucleolar GTP-binding protein [Grosmannia clavigera kw1407]EFX02591.1 nucleolar GTP-binding protein [Grosmannia clavigera kw1407]